MAAATLTPPAAKSKTTLEKPKTVKVKLERVPSEMLSVRKKKSKDQFTECMEGEGSMVIDKTKRSKSVLGIFKSDHSDSDHDQLATS